MKNNGGANSLAALFVLAISNPSFSSSCGDLDVKYNAFDVLNEEVFENGEGTPGPRRLVTEQTSHIISLSGKRFIQASFMDIDSISVKIEKTKGSRTGGKTTFVVCTIDENSRVEKLDEFSMKGGRRNIGDKLLNNYTNLRGKKLAIRLVGKSPFGDARFHIDLIRPDGEGKVWQPQRSTHNQAVTGFADLHVHQTSSLAFSGGWYWGSHESGGLAHQLPACDGHNHANLTEFLTSETLDLGPHPGKIYGYPDYSDWPRWDDIKHQQVGAKWLEDAHEGGLSLMVASVVNNQWLSAAMIASGNHNNRLSAADMEAAKRQIVSLHNFARENHWYEIVRDPWEARRAVEAGKLAVVLAVEVSDLFPKSDGDWRQQLHDIYDMGVRSVQLAHQTNSLFSGAAFHEDTFKALGKVKATFDADIEYASSGDGKHNQIGLSPLGEQLVTEMIRLNMLIDIAHLSLVAQRQVYELAKAADYYPLFNSHTRIQNLLFDDDLAHFKEHMSSDEILTKIKDTGGMIGLRTGQERVKTFTPKNSPAVQNNCDGSSRSYAQSYLYAKDFGIAIGLSSDFNGFIQQMPPRFGKDACAGQKNSTLRQQQVQAQIVPADPSELSRQFMHKGLAHIGYLPALIDDLDAIGADTQNLRSSAEDFLNMWQRAYDSSRSKVSR